MDTQKNYTRNIKTAGHCLCWAHARRKFVDAAPAYAKETDGLENTLVKAGIDQISQLFDKEKEYKSLSPEERYERRLGEEKTILKALFAWAENNVDKLLPKSSLAIETAKANDLDPERYLKYFFEKLPNTANFKDAEALNQYLPWATKPQEKCKG